MALKDGLRVLLIRELRDLYDADKQLVKAFPKLARAAGAESIVNLCREGVEYTQERIKRLERAFDLLDTPPRAKRSHAMSGLIRQASETAEENFSEADMDAALLAAIQKISHYGVAGYDAAHDYAAALGEREITDILHESLEEKRDAVVEEEGIAKDEMIPRILKADAIEGKDHASSRPGRRMTPSRGPSRPKPRSGSGRAHKANKRRAR